MVVQLLTVFVVAWGVAAERNRRVPGLADEFCIRLLFLLQAFLFQSQLFLLVLYSSYLCLLYLNLVLARKFELLEFNRFPLPALLFIQQVFQLPITFFSLSGSFLLKLPTPVLRHGHFCLGFRAVSLRWGHLLGWRVEFRHWRWVGFGLLVLYLLLPFPGVLLLLP